MGATNVAPKAFSGGGSGSNVPLGGIGICLAAPLFIPIERGGWCAFASILWGRAGTLIVLGMAGGLTLRYWSVDAVLLTDNEWSRPGSATCQYPPWPCHLAA